MPVGGSQKPRAKLRWGGGELLLMAVWVEGERRDRTGWKDRKRGEPDKL